MEIWMAVLIFVAGQMTTVLYMLFERRWRKEDVKAAERRVRLASRHEQVGRYAKALQEYISRVLSTTEERFTNRLEQDGSERLLTHWDKVLKESWERAWALELACGWEFSVEDRIAESLLIQLDLWGTDCLLYWQAVKGGESADPPQVDRVQVIELTRKLLKRLDEIG